MFNAIVGERWTTEDVMTAGERIWNLERMFNLRAGIGADQDTLPKRLLAEPLTEGAAEGQVHHLDQLLPGYYQERGWGPDGIPTDEKLAQLALQ